MSAYSLTEPYVLGGTFTFACVASCGFCVAISTCVACFVVVGLADAWKDCGEGVRG